MVLQDCRSVMSILVPFSEADHLAQLTNHRWLFWLFRMYVYISGVYDIIIRLNIAASSDHRGPGRMCELAQVAKG